MIRELLGEIEYDCGQVVDTLGFMGYLVIGLCVLGCVILFPLVIIGIATSYLVTKHNEGVRDGRGESSDDSVTVGHR